MASEIELIRLGPLLAAAIGYLLLLFLVAEAAERGWIPPALARHPLTFALSLGVYATSWTFYGSIGLATRQGYGFLTIYLGVTLACLAVPLIWLPLLRVVRNQQLSSLADLFAYRYHSRTAGALVAVFMVVASMPYLALQIRAVSTTAGALTHSAEPRLVGMVFCGTIAVFAISFGARHVGPMKAHPGLVVSMAMETVFKVVALALVAGYCMTRHFDGFTGFHRWIQANPEALEQLVEPTRTTAWVTLMLLSFSAAFLLPRQFHMAFAKQPTDRAFIQATWAFPFVLLVMNLPIPLVLWAAKKQALQGSPDLYVLGVVAETPALALVVFLGGVAAASGMVIVCSLAVAGMVMNHLLLPLWRPMTNFFETVTWLRRLMVAAVIFGGFVVAQQETGGVLAELGLLTFVAVAQFLPGLVGVLLWPEATRAGFLAGLSAGIVMWAGLLVLPLGGWTGLHDFVMIALPDGAGADRWSLATWPSVVVNAVVFGAVSLLTKPRPEERRAAENCMDSVLARGVRGRRRPEELAQVLKSALGAEAAAQEVERARQQVGMTREDDRPWKLGELENRLEVNLSGVVGPVVARQMLGREALPTPSPLADQVQLLDRANPRRLPSAAGPIDVVRRFFGGVLEDLPLGVCAVGPTGEVLVWNQVLVQLSELPKDVTVGHQTERLPAPWADIIREQASEAQPTELKVSVGGRDRILEVGRSRIGLGGYVVVVEDLTEAKLLQVRMAHNDRLRSIGRLAAGVAHEIGNPLAGILMVARNLQGEPDPEDVPERLQLVVSEASRIKSIVESLVSFSRSDGSGPHAPPTRRAVVPVRSVIDDAARLIALTRHDVRFVTEVPKDLSVFADPQQITQVLINLLSNACDASPAGGEIRLAGRQIQHEILLQVSDEGRGMDQDVQSKIFEPFFTTKDPGAGTGLGLAIVHRIVDDHGGSIDVDSAPDRGTTFSIHLPAVGGRA